LTLLCSAGTLSTNKSISQNRKISNVGEKLHQEENDFSKHDEDFTETFEPHGLKIYQFFPFSPTFFVLSQTTVKNVSSYCPTGLLPTPTPKDSGTGERVLRRATARHLLF